MLRKLRGINHAGCVAGHSALPFMWRAVQVCVCVCQSVRASEHQSTGLHKWLSLKHMAAVVPFLFIICHPGTEHL